MAETISDEAIIPGTEPIPSEGDQIYLLQSNGYTADQQVVVVNPEDLQRFWRPNYCPDCGSEMQGPALCHCGYRSGERRYQDQVGSHSKVPLPDSITLRRTLSDPAASYRPQGIEPHLDDDERVEVIETAPVEARIARLEGDLKRASDGWFAANEREEVLEAEVERLRAALAPLAAYAELVDRYGHDDNSTCTWRFSARQVRGAREAMTNPAESDHDG